MEIVHFVESHGVYLYCVTVWFVYALQMMPKSENRNAGLKAAKVVGNCWHVFVTLIVIAAIVKGLV